MIKKTTKKYFLSKTGNAVIKEVTKDSNYRDPFTILPKDKPVSINHESYTIMDLEKDFENDSENLEDFDDEVDNKNFTGKLN